MRKFLLLLCALTLAGSGRTEDAPQLTRLFVLGTAHLSAHGDELKPSMLDGLMERLRGLAPDVVMVEALPGPSITLLRQLPGTEEVLKNYAGRQTDAGALAQQALGVSWEAAYAEIAQLDADCSAANAIDCLLTYLAAYEYDTALLKYLRLGDEEKNQFRKRYPDIAERFRRSLESKNELYSIAQRLALELDLPRIFPVDAHREKPPLNALFDRDKTAKPFYTGLFAESGEHPFIVESRRREQAALASGNLLGYYQWLNSPAAMEADFEFQWAPFVEQDIESHFGKARLAFWDQRNLLIAANIARVLGEHPGKTGILVIGSGHKSFIDGYFENANWIEVLTAADVLGTERTP